MRTKRLFYLIFFTFPLSSKVFYGDVLIYIVLTEKNLPPLPFFFFCIFLKNNVQANASSLEFLNLPLIDNTTNTVLHSCLLNVNRLFFFNLDGVIACIFLDCFVDSVILKLELTKGI